MNNQLEFVKELEKLTKKYGVAIEGCGCCGSPYLKNISVDSDPEWGFYTYSSDLEAGFDNLWWCDGKNKTRRSI